MKVSCQDLIAILEFFSTHQVPDQVQIRNGSSPDQIIPQVLIGADHILILLFLMGRGSKNVTFKIEGPLVFPKNKCKKNSKWVSPI